MEYNKQRLENAKAHAKSKGGDCFSTEYKNSHTKMEWKCSCQNHKPWSATYNNIVSHGQWCPECAIYKPKNPKGLEIAKAHALAKNGQCLSTEYNNSYTKMEWKCSCQNHKPWTARYDNVVNNGSWCPECAIKTIRNPKGLEIAKAVAKEKGGNCLSTEYKNSYTKMEWKCSCQNHKPWSATYNSVISMGSWCSECANKKPKKTKQKNPKGLEKAKQHAKSKGGECLSNEYLGNHKKMVWKCACLNHKTWTARYSSVINMGSWCPECAGKIKGGNHD